MGRSSNLPAMDVHLAVASKRDSRAYSGADVPDETAERILDAGRLVGSARNRQPFRFIVVEGEAVPPIADTVYVPGNVLDAGLVVVVVVSPGGNLVDFDAGLVVVVVVSPGGNLVDFDAGRAAQSMMLAGWAEGITSCPNGIADSDALDRHLAIEAPERAVVVISFGPPRRPRDPARRTPEEWSARAKRQPLDSIVSHVGAVHG